MENIKIVHGHGFGKIKTLPGTSGHVLVMFMEDVTDRSIYSCEEVEKQNLESLTLSTRNVYLNFELMHDLYIYI